VRVRNTGITYGSDERKPQILQEFAELLPPLTEEQRQALEADILWKGCYSPIVVDTVPFPKKQTEEEVKKQNKNNIKMSNVRLSNN